MSASYGSKSPSNRRYAQEHEQQPQHQHQSRRKALRDQQEHQMREQHSSFPSSTRGGSGVYQGGGYIQQPHIEVHRGPEVNRGRHSQHRSLSASRGHGNKNNQYHQSAAWVSDNELLVLPYK